MAPEAKAGSARPVLVKIGGSMMDDEAALAGVCAALAALRRQGMPLALVHGGGKDINRHLAWLQEAPVFKDGLRVTGPAALKVVEMTLSGYVNKKLAGLLNASGGRAAGLSGVDGPTFLAERISEDLGMVGRIVKVDPALVEALLASGFLPVVSPISVGWPAVSDSEGAGGADVPRKAPPHYNVNADDAASALAAALRAEKLIFVSDVEGVRGRDGARIPALDGAGVERLIADGVATGGMIPKLRSCRSAVEAGIGEVHICKWEGPEAFAAQVRGTGNTGTVLR
jgi:acetylglutamate kinase